MDRHATAIIIWWAIFCLYLLSHINMPTLEVPPLPSIFSFQDWLSDNLINKYRGEFFMGLCTLGGASLVIIAAIIQAQGSMNVATLQQKQEATIFNQEMLAFSIQIVNRIDMTKDRMLYLGYQMALLEHTLTTDDISDYVKKSMSTAFTYPVWEIKHNEYRYYAEAPQSLLKAIHTLNKNKEKIIKILDSINNNKEVPKESRRTGAQSVNIISTNITDLFRKAEIDVHIFINKTRN